LIEIFRWTGLYKMVYAIGSQPCLQDVYSYEDPHAHHYGVDDWHHQGIATGLDLADGPYHFVVQGMNSAIFGGSLVTTVCHSVPIIVDHTPPLVNSVDTVVYDDEKQLIKAAYATSFHFAISSLTFRLPVAVRWLVPPA
jgi:uncharacterized membrane protein YeiH